jgi:hypothetical protein
MQTSMDIGILVFVVMPQRFDDGSRFLRSSSVIEIDERMFIYPFPQDGKILSDLAPGNFLGRLVCHGSICARRADAVI